MGDVTMTTKKSFHSNLAKRRKELGLTQEMLAQKMPSGVWFLSQERTVFGTKIAFTAIRYRLRWNDRTESSCIWRWEHWYFRCSWGFCLKWFYRGRLRMHWMIISWVRWRSCFSVRWKWLLDRWFFSPLYPVCPSSTACGIWGKSVRKWWECICLRRCLPCW